MDPNWLIAAVSAVGAIIALLAAGSARKSAKAAEGLTAIEREKLRRASEPSFRAKYLAPQGRIAFTMVTGPTDICEVRGFVVPDEDGQYVKVDSPFDLGYMQIGDTREISADPVHGRPKGDLQQHFIVEVHWQHGDVPVAVYCSIPPDSDVMIAFV